jgi:ferritin
MLSRPVQEAINEHINRELYSAYLYLSMAAYSEAINLSGFAHWFRVQFREEVDHALKFFDFVNARGGRVTLQAIAQPPSDFGSPTDLFERTLTHEREVTEGIYRLHELAIRENEHACLPLVQWFIAEQIEEEKTADQILQQLKLVGDEGPGLFLLDQQLGARTAAPEA